MHTHNHKKDMAALFILEKWRCFIWAVMNVVIFIDVKILKMNIKYI